MNWIVFAIFAYLALALENGLDQMLSVGVVTPSFVLIVAVYVAMTANRSAVPWALLILGLLEDLTHPYHVGHGLDLPVVGPYALGYLAAAAICLQLRGMMATGSPLSVALLVIPAGILMQVVAVAMVTLRRLPLLQSDPVTGWIAADELVHRFGVLGYTAALALPVGFVLIRTAPLWRFAHAATARSRARRLGVGGGAVSRRDPRGGAL